MPAAYPTSRASSAMTGPPASPLFTTQTWHAHAQSSVDNLLLLVDEHSFAGDGRLAGFVPPPTTRRPAPAQRREAADGCENRQQVQSRSDQHANRRDEPDARRRGQTAH